MKRKVQACPNLLANRAEVVLGKRIEVEHVNEVLKFRYVSKETRVRVTTTTITHHNRNSSYECSDSGTIPGVIGLHDLQFVRYEAGK